jgi:hypothetical protein
MNSAHLWRSLPLKKEGTEQGGARFLSVLLSWLTLLKKDRIIGTDLMAAFTSGSRTAALSS